MKHIKNKNILNSFFKRGFIAMVITMLISSFGIYYYQDLSFSNSLEQHIKNHIDIKLSKYNTTLKEIDKNMLESDVKDFMKSLNLLSVEVYDEQKDEIISIKVKGDRYKEQIALLKGHDKYLIHIFPDDKKMSTNFFELADENYFVQLFYPLYKDGLKLGYIEGISQLDTMMVNRFKRGIIATIITVIFTVLTLCSILFPIVYFAYKKLEHNRIELLASNIMTINTLGNAIALRDSDTNEHNYRVTIYSIKLAQYINLDDENIKKLIKGAFLHDVGKIGISDNILLKNGKLSDEEFEIMKQHVLKGVSLIKGNSWLEDSCDVILCHHEKYDGSGYPRSLKGKDIPKIARIFAIVDVFDALTSKRPYKEPFSYEKTIDILKQSANSHFDAEILNSFFDISQEFYNHIRSKDQQELKEILDNLTKDYFLTH